MINLCAMNSATRRMVKHNMMASIMRKITVQSSKVNIDITILFPFDNFLLLRQLKHPMKWYTEPLVSSCTLLVKLKNISFSFDAFLEDLTAFLFFLARMLSLLEADDLMSVDVLWTRLGKPDYWFALSDPYTLWVIITSPSSSNPNAPDFYDTGSFILFCDDACMSSETILEPTLFFLLPKSLSYMVFTVLEVSFLSRSC